MSGVIPIRFRMINNSRTNRGCKPMFKQGCEERRKQIETSERLVRLFGAHTKEKTKKNGDEVI
jgi:hypothetical protein